MTQLEIVNDALGLISVAPIASMAEVSPAAQLATRIWGSSRREALRQGYPFNTALVELSTSSYTLVANDWSYAYTYPGDCLAVNRVYYLETDKAQDYRVIYDHTGTQLLILSNIAEAIAETSFDLDTPSIFDATFTNVLSHLLASKMAIPLAGSKELADKKLEIYVALSSDALRIAGRENKSRDKPSSAFVDAREGPSLQSEDHYVAVRHPNG